MKGKSTSPKRGRPRQFDVDAALDQAMRVFWQKGYLGASLSDLTAAMGINRPSLYSAFGDKESLFRQAMDRYRQGPAAFLNEALNEPTARGVAERMMRGVVCVGTDTCNPRGCMWIHGTLSAGDPDDPLRKELVALRLSSETALRKRFAKAVAEGDLPSDADPATLARYVASVNFGLSVQAATGATRVQLLKVIEAALAAFPNAKT